MRIPNHYYEFKRRVNRNAAVVQRYTCGFSMYFIPLRMGCGCISPFPSVLRNYRTLFVLGFR